MCERALWAGPYPLPGKRGWRDVGEARIPRNEPDDRHEEDVKRRNEIEIRRKRIENDIPRIPDTPIRNRIVFQWTLA